MGIADEIMFEEQEQLAVATKIAVEAGVLARCEFHGCVYDAFNGDHTPAYKLGNYLFTNGRLPDVFYDRQVLTDSIKAVINDAGMDCYECARFSAE